MPVIGKTTEALAVGFVTRNSQARLGSMTPEGLRRVVCDIDCIDREHILASFDDIAVAKIPAMKSATQAMSKEPPLCNHRGSQRHTCCGSPDIWICRHHKEDCVTDFAAAKKLQSMVSTPEAARIKVCSTCRDRKVSQQAAIPDVDLWPAMARRTQNGFSVGFISAAYMPVGGTETFHRALLPRLKNVVDIAGFVATGFHGGDGSKLDVPYATGVEASQRLAAHCNVVVVWGIHDLPMILPAKRPRVIAVHHSDWSSDWNNRLILNQLDLIDEVVCVNRDTASKLASCGKPVHFVPNAIDPARLIPSGNQLGLKAQFKIQEDSKIVLFGHRLSAEKRPHLAVQIANNLPTGWTMVIAGDGVERSSINECAAKCDRVRVVGACDSLADWISISDCFLSLSTFEGFGLAIGEAMAAGLPTVSTPTGIAPGLATTIPSQSTPEEWADAIVNARRLVEPAVILERYSVQRMVSAWKDVIARVHQTSAGGGVGRHESVN